MLLPRGWPLTLVLAVFQFLPDWRAPDKATFSEAGFIAAFVVNAGVGAFIVWHRPANAVGWIVLRTSVSCSRAL